MKPASTASAQHMGLGGATLVGVGAIVGGGILALAGVAFGAAGPAAILAFALNGLIALITAWSFSELASRFPESGGTYTYAKKVYPVETAFTVGWVVWFASLVAAVLYALGLGTFGVLVAELIWNRFGTAPDWLVSRDTIRVLAVAGTLYYGWSLTRSSAGGGRFSTIGKVVLFAVLIAGGVWSLTRVPSGTVRAGLTPFLPAGGAGLVAAMGYTFIALQGFDLIAAVGGEVKDPVRTLPRAMFLSLGIALVIYIPLLILVSTVGLAPGESVYELGTSHPESIIAIAAQRFMGRPGYVLVLVAAALAMASALHANLLASSRVALAMARDHTLPNRLGTLHSVRGTPTIAILTGSGIVLGMVFLIPNLAAAGAVSSLIFLLSFALTHWMCFLARRRSARTEGVFLTPWFPLVPLTGLACCLALALFQGIVVPSAGQIAAVWIGVGGIAYLLLFARRARIIDASAEAKDPELIRLRGRNPLVLVPAANPANAAALMELANSMVPHRIGRVLLLTVVRPPKGLTPATTPPQLIDAQSVLREVLMTSFSGALAPQALTTISDSPWDEIIRVARLHRCDSLLLGFSTLTDEMMHAQLEQTISRADCDVAVLRAPSAWKPSQVKRVIVPLGGRSMHETLRARVLGNFVRQYDCEMVFLRILGTSVPEEVCERAVQNLTRFLQDEVPNDFSVNAVRGDDVAEALIGQLRPDDLVVLGLQRQGKRRKAFGTITLRIANETECAILMISSRG